MTGLRINQLDNNKYRAIAAPGSLALLSCLLACLLIKERRQLVGPAPSVSERHSIKSFLKCVVDSVQESARHSLTSQLPENGYWTFLSIIVSAQWFGRLFRRGNSRS